MTDTSIMVIEKPQKKKRFIVVSVDRCLDAVAMLSVVLKDLCLFIPLGHKDLDSGKELFTSHWHSGR